MKETNEIKEFQKLMAKHYPAINMFDFIKLIKLSVRHKKAVLKGKDDLATKIESASKSLNVPLVFNRKWASYTAFVDFGGPSNLADGAKIWGIPNGA